MKALHRLIVTSSTYRMASTPDAAERADRSRQRLSLAHAVAPHGSGTRARQSALRRRASSILTMGGPEIDHKQGLTSKRRSLYLRIAAEKEVEFLKIFDGPSVTECYQRRPRVMPQQALALANSETRHRPGAGCSRRRTRRECARTTSVRRARASDAILARPPTREEDELCREFLPDGARQHREAPIRSSRSRRRAPRKPRARAVQPQRLRHHPLSVHDYLATSRIAARRLAPLLPRRHRHGLHRPRARRDALSRRHRARATPEAPGARRMAGRTFARKAKSVIWIFLCGGVSHLESFDVKPALNKYAGKSIDETPYKDVLDRRGQEHHRRQSRRTATAR